MTQLASCTAVAPIAADNTGPPVRDTRAGAARPAHRILLIGTESFVWLRRLQEKAPGPRVDLRYLIEGAITVLQADATLQPRWMELSRQALVSHVSGRHGASDRTSGTSGTGRGQPQAEGAHARASGASHGHGRHDDCKALQIGEAAFEWLKGVQGTTRDPRLDIRYLVEGALALLQQHPDLLPVVVGHSRRSLCEHLVQLQQLPIQPFFLEISQ